MSFVFVQVSKNNIFKMNQEDFAFENCKLIQVSNNNLPLTNVYNKYLESLRQEKNTDFIVFLHADVKFNVLHLIEHIKDCQNKYDVFGLCGASIVDLSQSPLNWWTSSNPTPQGKWGCVTHGELGNKKSFFNIHSPDITDHEVALIDGLCIIFGPKALNSDLKFDENFKYDFYDTDISLQSILKYKFKLGVLVEDSLEHYSVGKSILSQDFLKNEKFFRNKWNLN